MLTSAEIRRRFIDFFVEQHGHTFAPSSPVVPHDDPTLLFTNAGMNQFKPIFLGQAAPGSDLATLRRAVNSQKCIRAGGKHNDLDDVGKDLYHHTFFEMLGNWSFGDYFKKEAIDWAWNLLVHEWGIDAERLYATYFGGDPELGLEPDEEARTLWLTHLPEGRVLPGGMKDNFWEMGDTGPCGPCSEIHFDSRPDAERSATPGRSLVNADHEDVIELWNLVFIQFNRKTAGLRPLPARHVDTGMGLERITRVIQGKRSNYDTDLFTPLFEKVRAITGAEPYGGAIDEPRDIAYRVIADHIRTLVFAITDGAEPSNEGRGYVLRRILRRAVRHGRQTLGAQGPFLCDLAPTVVEMMGGFFPELTKNPQRVIDILRDEEEAFGKTLEHGVGYFWQVFSTLPMKPRQPGRKTECSIISSGGARFLAVTDRILDDRTPEQLRANLTLLPDTEDAANPTRFHESDITREWTQKHLQQPAAITADAAFTLHDTYGFPIDLTQIMAEERGLTVDVEGFERLMEEARERSRAGGAGGGGDPVIALTTDAVASLQKLHVKPTDDAAKYDADLRPVGATVRAIWNGSDFDENAVIGSVFSHRKQTSDPVGRASRPSAPESLPPAPSQREGGSAAASSQREAPRLDRIAVILDRTGFYAQAGGQVGDTGRLAVTKEALTSARDQHEGGEFIVEDTRITAGYVLHIGRVRKGEVRVGDRVECRLDKPRRRRVMANHTGTHLLNFALRETLGEHVEQKGSLVAEDRLRFDFSHGEPVSPAEIERLERIVRERIAQDLEVFTGEAPLAQAQVIAGVRAVFGETYPDPVRVVSIGAPIAEMLARPDDAEWRESSVEFCGGTHVGRTGAIEHVALVAEEPVAKGVRRVVCLTGVAAAAAVQAGVELRRRVEAAAALEGAALVDETHEIAALVDSAVAPVTDRSAVRAALESLQDRIKAARKQAAAGGRALAVEEARTLAERQATGDVVEEINADGDRGALLAALDVIRAKRPESAVMLLSADRDAGKVTIVASVSEARIAAGLKAGDWVRLAASACGGKGGGRPDSAQGGGTQPEKIGEAVEAARAYAAERE